MFEQILHFFKNICYHYYYYYLVNVETNVYKNVVLSDGDYQQDDHSEEDLNTPLVERQSISFRNGRTNNGG